MQGDPLIVSLSSKMASRATAAALYRMAGGVGAGQKRGRHCQELGVHT